FSDRKCPVLNNPSTHLPKEAHAARRHPFHDENVPAPVEAGVVRMDETTLLPAFRLPAHLEAVERLLRPLRIVTEMREHTVVPIEQCNAGVQVGNEKNVVANVEMRGEADFLVERQMLAVQCEVLQAGIGPVGHNERWFASRTLVQPQAV